MNIRYKSKVVKFLEDYEIGRISSEEVYKDLEWSEKKLRFRFSNIGQGSSNLQKIMRLEFSLLKKHKGI